MAPMAGVFRHRRIVVVLLAKALLTAPDLHKQTEETQVQRCVNISLVCTQIHNIRRMIICA